MRVLVVDDEARMAALLKRGLQEDGYVVDVAATGTEAIWRVGQFDYDVVVLDVMLPELDGFEVCRRLRTAGKEMPVVMLSARDELEDRARWSAAGADDYLTKPFSFTELSARVGALIRRGAARCPPTPQAASDRMGGGQPAPNPTPTQRRRNPQPSASRRIVA